MDSGVVQSVIVLAFSVVFNISRWFEFEYDVITSSENVTEEDGRVVLRNVSAVMVKVRITNLSDSTGENTFKDRTETLKRCRP